MNKILISLFVLVIASGPALAEIGMGYEVLTVLPHALTFYVRDKNSGWGGKLSSGFGTSILSGMVKTVSAVATLGLADFDSVVFYSLNVTRDITADKKSRSYWKFGAWLFAGTLGSETKTVAVPNLGVGWEWDRSFMGLTSSLELGFPGILLLGARHYF
jgi:hypothetical protein